MTRCRSVLGRLALATTLVLAALVSAASAATLRNFELVGHDPLYARYTTGAAAPWPSADYRAVSVERPDGRTSSIRRTVAS